MSEWSQVARRVRVPLGFAFAILYFWLAHPTWRSLGIGMFLLIPGLWLRALASGHVRKNEALATTGPYAYIRNPLYLGSLLLGIGFALMGRNWWVGLLLVAMFFVIYLPVIRGEEVFLTQKFPEFQAYARQVPRLIPGLRPLPKAEGPGGSFSFDLYAKHREYNALVGVTALVALLIIKMKVWPG